MFSEIIISKTFNSVVFESRNQNYGAYELRSVYHQHIKRSALIVLFFITTMFGFSYLKLRNNSAEKFIPKIHPEIIFSKVKIDPFVLPKSIPHHELPKVHPVSVAATTPKSAIPTKIEDDSKVKNIYENKITESNPLSSSTSGISTKGVVSGTIETKQGNGTIETATPQPKVPTLTPDVMPEFPGGEAAMMKFLEENLHYTERARISEIEGKVVMNFIVNENGEITDCKIIRNLGYGLDEIATSVVKKMPRWKPGKQHGEPVSVYFTLPIDFLLN
jgi:periplasmic protein TonB